MKPVVIFGASDAAQIAHYYLLYDSDFKVAAFTVDKAYCLQESFCELPLVPFEEVENLYSPSAYDMFVVLGYSKLNTIRASKFKEAKIKGYDLISYVSSGATTWPDLDIGENCFILEDNTIQPFVKIGNNVTLWSGNHVGHHSEIGDNCFISSHVVISGRVKIGENCFIGVNATLKDHITIAENCIIGAGSLILKDTKENQVYVGAKSNSLSLPSNRLKNML